ncbi:MAG: EAL domain-containing protein [Candidatus Thiodiazotropha sp.]
MFSLELRTYPEDGATTLVKYPTSALPPPKVLARLEREYEIGVSLNLPAVRRVFSRTEWKGRPAIELEYIRGESFKSYFGMPENRRLDRVLRLALSGATALKSLHASGVLHRDIAASNLLVRETGEHAVIIDLEFATQGDAERDFVFSTEGQLPYLSPEQTGRIALPVDERSDLYAFGVVLYEMLTGESPFSADDAPGWIHAHLAREPEPPSVRVATIPKVVSDIVVRLLAKAPENRYQSARGLCHDLKQCLDALDTEGYIPTFLLGYGDRSGRLRFPPSLYGRDQERRKLQTFLERAIAGEPGLVFISGFAGVGKTALVNELRFPVAASAGRFISGKFDQTLRALPYAALAMAFSQLCQQLLAGTPAELESFRLRVLETLGANAGLLLELVPELEAVIGAQPAPAPLETVESANRFAVALLGFFHCTVDAEHPLVLFLDDMQWSDTGSLELLRMIVTRAVRSHFLIICAYRDNRLIPAHPLLKLIENIQREWSHVGRIALQGLTREQSTELLAGALDASNEEVAPLAELIHAKTDGNPFFMRQVLAALVNEGAVHFEPLSDSWRWETARVKAQDISDNVIQLMLHKIARLPPATRKVLEAAACIGNTFSFELLAVAARYGKDKIKQALAPAVDEGLVALLGGTARFTHDRIQQAVYQSMDEREAQRIHLCLGRYLIGQRNERDLPLVAAQQLNLGSALIDTDEERLRLAELNLEAGRAVSAAMAYVAAQEFYTTGEALLGVIDADDSSLLFELRFRSAEVDFYLGDVDVAIQRFQELMKSVADAIPRTRIYQMLIDIHTVEHRLAEALALGKEALAGLDVSIPDGYSSATLIEDVEEIDRLLDEQGIDRIASWPEMQDQRELATAGLLTHLMPPAYISAAKEFPFLATEFVRCNLQGGLSRFSPFAFGVYGMLLAAALERYESAQRMGRLAAEIARRPECLGLRARANFFHAVFIMHWCEPLEATLPYLDKGWRAGVETGDLQFASYCVNHIHGNGLLAGQSLAELEQSLSQFADVNRVIRQEDGQQFFSMLERIVDALRYPSDVLPHLSADIGGETIVETWCKSGNATLLSFYHVMNCMLAIIMDRPVDALNAAEQAEPFLGGIMGMAWVPQHHFLHALALADAARDSRVKLSVAEEKIDKYCKRLEAWAEHGSSNFLPKLLLLKAEMCELAEEGHGVLLDAYDLAIDAATHADRTLEQALACERAAGCWLRRKTPQLAGLYLQRSIQSYESWGGDAKIAQLMRDRASLLLPLQPRDREGDSVSTSSSSSDKLHAADVYSVLKAAQTVAGELVMDRMLARLIGLVIEMAGAQYGYLLLEQEGEWCVVAEQHPERTSVEVLQWRPLSDCSEIAASVVLYVARTGKSVNLDNAAKSTLFAADSSIAARHCKSLLCLPIINRGELGGILYLENNLASHAFTRTHTQILQLLTTQAISSLEISRYYARVQTLNRSLEEEIEERKRTESKLEFLANHDPLTNLPNRRLFYDRVQHSIQRAQRSGIRVAVLFLDLDQFKNVNDTLSHQVGDRLLQLVAQRLAAQVRDEDTLGRLGGDEYVLLMEGKFNLHDLSIIADKLLGTFLEPVNVDGHDLHPTCSLGISLFPDDATDADELLRHADAAMYQAKQLGRNTYHFFSASLAEAAAERLALERDLRHAIEREEFELYFQPQVEMMSGKIIGAEALVRWNHPQRGLMLPQSFIPLAEESGNIIALGEWVLRRACRQLSQWQQEGIGLGSLAVNVSGCQFALDQGFAALVKRILDDSDIVPSHLELELTESVIMQNTEKTMHSLAELNAIGVRLAIDDFGTGYSSLSYLHRLPVQRLKIDRSFVSNLPHAHDAAVIVQSIMVLGRNLGKQIVAEGIETIEQQQFLQKAGCIEGQGYLFGAPMPGQTFAELLQKNEALHGGRDQH